MAALALKADKAQRCWHVSFAANSGSMRRSKTALPCDQLVRADEHPPIGLYGISTADRPHSALMLRARITLPHFSVSSAMNFPNAADVIDIGSTPKPASRALMAGSAAMALISLLSLSITSVGVSFGAPTPYHWFAS